jgi:hypothetical protein
MVVATPPRCYSPDRALDIYHAKAGSCEWVSDHLLIPDKSLGTVRTNHLLTQFNIEILAPACRVADIAA